MPENEVYDITIVGGGPAGMYAAFYAGMRNMSVKLIEGKGELGGFLHMYPEKMIWDVGGVPPIRCAKLIEWLAGQAMTFGPTLAFNERVDELLRLADNTFALRTSSGHTHCSRTVIVAAGRGVTEAQKLDIEGADRYELTNLYYTVQDPAVFRGKRVLVSGGGDSAVDWAIELVERGASVILVHRNEEFRAMEYSVARVREIADVRTSCRIVKLQGREDAIHAVTIGHADGGAEMTVDVDAVVVSHGYSSNYGGLADLGLEIADGAIRFC